jgi:hypothetical protein
MELGKKIIGSAAILAIAIGIGEYKIYKKFENAPHPFQEIVRWPYNDVCSEAEELYRQYEEIRDLPLKSFSGKISRIERIGGDARIAGLYTFRRDPISFVKFTDGTELAYAGDFFAGESDEVRTSMFPAQDITKVQELWRKVGKFREEHHTWFWITRGYDEVLDRKARIKDAIRTIPETKLSHLDGLIEEYEIIKDN